MSAESNTPDGGKDASTRIKAESLGIGMKQWQEDASVWVEPDGGTLVELHTALFEGDISAYMRPEEALTLADELETVATALIEDVE